MEQFLWQRVSRDREAPLKKRRSSPLPGAVGSRAGGSQPCRRQLFGSVGPRGWPEPGSQKRKCNVKTLPKIKEIIQVTQVSQLCNQSNQEYVKESTDLEKKEDEAEASSAQLQESLVINIESKESLKSVEVTSSTGLTLPTGVSTFLLECLDVDSTADYNADTSGSLSSCPSPETFRDDGSERSNSYPEDSGKYKNSTLLDSSKAVAIDKIPQISDLSAILEPVLKDLQGQYTTRKSSSHYDYSSTLNVSTTLAGKKICKIAAARERTPDKNSGMCSSTPLGLERKPDNQTAKSKRLKPEEKGKTSHTFEDPSSVGQLDAPGDTSARSPGLAAQEPPPKQTDAVEPVSRRREICSIVRTSPGHRRFRLHRVPVNREDFWLARGVPEVDLQDSDSFKQTIAQISITLQGPKIGSAVNNTDEISAGARRRSNCLAAVAGR